MAIGDDEPDKAWLAAPPGVGQTKLRTGVNKSIEILGDLLGLGHN